nr:hypothetical protein CFP56_61650 [Quercus suber]
MEIHYHHALLSASACLRRRTEKTTRFTPFCHQNSHSQFPSLPHNKIIQQWKQERGFDHKNGYIDCAALIMAFFPKHRQFGMN